MNLTLVSDRTAHLGDDGSAADGNHVGNLGGGIRLDSIGVVSAERGQGVA